MEPDEEVAAAGDLADDGVEVEDVATNTAELTGCSYPSQVIDVSRWKLQLPVGDPVKEVKVPTLEAYRYSPYFRLNDACSAVRFRAPTNGTTTPGSQYPRSELREMKSDGVTQASWSTTSGTHTMYIDQAVTALPKGKRHIAVGQIHNGSNDIIMIRVEGSRLIVKPNGLSAVTLDSTYSLGQRFTVKLVASGGYIKVYYNGSSTPKVTMKKSSSSAYFKAGAYTQSNCESEDDYGKDCGSDNYGEVSIYDLWVKHS
jgi:poly(beta-D-mannuronate) lyase